MRLVSYYCYERIVSDHLKECCSDERFLFIGHGRGWYGWRRVSRVKGGSGSDWSQFLTSLRQMRISVIRHPTPPWTTHPPLLSSLISEERSVWCEKGRVRAIDLLGRASSGQFTADTWLTKCSNQNTIKTEAPSTLYKNNWLVAL